ncbi:MAG: response regulator transcription factor [Chloroflexota bacterium]
MSDKIRVAILDDYASNVGGYVARLEKEPDIEVVHKLYFGEELEPALASAPVNVLLLDVQVPNSPDDHNLYPILHLIPRLLDRYQEHNLAVLIITMHNQRTLIRTLLEAGASGYVLKDDRVAYEELPSIIRTVAAGGIFLSPEANKQLRKRHTGELEQPLSPRQAELLSLCAAYPDESIASLAKKMYIAYSTARNLLSQAYLKLGVNSLPAALAKARRLGLLAPEMTPPPRL